MELNSEKRKLEYEDNDDVREVAKLWIEYFKNIALKDVPYMILQTIAAHFPPHKNWKEFAGALGIHGLHELDKIEGDSLVKQIWPSEVILVHHADSLPHSFSDLLTILQHLRRFDCLQTLHDLGSVAELLQRHQLQEKLKTVLVPEFSTPVDFQNDTTLSNDLLKNLNNYNVDKIQLGTLLDQKNELEVYQICQVAIGAPKTIRTCSVLLPKSAKQENVCVEKKLVNGVNNTSCHDILNNTITLRTTPKKRMAILLTYSEDANNIVADLHQRFWEIEFGVVSELVLRGKGYFETNFITSWESFFKQTKFVVPLITAQYIKDIKRPKDDLQSRGVKFIYELYTRRFVSDGCLNHSVRPLVVEDLPSNSLRALNPVLETRWKIPHELDSFFDMMKNYACAR